MLRLVKNDLNSGQEEPFFTSLTHWQTQLAVRRSEPSMSFAFNSSLLSVDGMTCLLPFES